MSQARNGRDPKAIRFGLNRLYAPLETLGTAISGWQSSVDKRFGGHPAGISAIYRYPAAAIRQNECLSRGQRNTWVPLCIGFAGLYFCPVITS